MAVLRLPALALCLLAALAAIVAQAQPEDAQPEDAPPADVAPAGDNRQDDAAPQRAYMIPVPLPISGDVDTRVKRMVTQVLQQAESLAAERRPVLILEFRGKQGQAGRGSEFERSLALARFLSGRELSGVRTVAYVPDTVEGHAVLPVIACEEIVMRSEAELGRAGLDEEFIEETMRLGYAEIAKRRGVFPAPVALAMLDKELEVLRVKTTEGVRYVTRPELEELEKTVVIESVDTVSGQGELAHFTGHDLRNTYRFASHLAESQKDLAVALRLPPGGIEENPALGEKWRAVAIELSGVVDSSWVQWVQRGVEEQIRSGDVNFVCVRIDSPGGFPLESVALANFLVTLDPSQVRTVAFVEKEALSDAALVAMACDHLVVAPRARLGGGGELAEEGEGGGGGFFGVPGEGDAREGFDPQDIQTTVIALAEEKNRDWSLISALVDPRVVVHRYTLPSGAVRYFCEEELAEQENPADWKQGAEIDTRDGLRGEQAEELGLARYLAADFAELQALYHLEEEPAAIEPNWAHAFIESLGSASAWLAPTLLFIAVMALFSEASSPGLGVPGFVSAVCFVLFFWSQFLNGTAGWLEILLFVTGIVCVGVEIFLVPGFGVFGVGGGALIVTSVVLASQTFVIPHNSEELRQLPYSLSMVLVSAAGAAAALVFVRHLLPRTQYGRRLLLQPPSGAEAEQLRQRESLVDWTHLAGKRGVTTTPLTPSGKARFGDEIVAVISDSELIEPGTAVYVEEVLGNRVLVKPVEDAR